MCKGSVIQKPVAASTQNTTIRPMATFNKGDRDGLEFIVLSGSFVLKGEECILWFQAFLPQK